jgi:arginyl-tRNA synthetase
MKQKLALLIRQALQSAFRAGTLQREDVQRIHLEIPKIAAHGDFSTNVAMTMAASQRRAPQEIARILIDHIEDPDRLLSESAVAGAGFINFFIAQDKWHEVLKAVHEKDTAYGTSQVGLGKRVQIEFLSANPTGPLHVGHGRCAAVGDTLAAVLKAAGYEVEKEYYVNDSGRQIHTLGESVFIRYQQLLGKTVHLSAEDYQGDYIKDLARMLLDGEEENLLGMTEEEAVTLCARFAARHTLCQVCGRENPCRYSGRPGGLWCLLWPLVQ